MPQRQQVVSRRFDSETGELAAEVLACGHTVRHFIVTKQHAPDPTALFRVCKQCPTATKAGTQLVARLNRAVS